MREDLINQYFTVSTTMQRAWKHRVLAAFEHEHISIAQMGLLFMIHEQKSVISKDLAKHMHITRSAVAQLIDGLAEPGYIERTEDEKDRRIIHISLSKKGRNVLKRLEKQRRKIFDELVCELNEEQLKAGIEIQEAMLRRLER